TSGGRTFGTEGAFKLVFANKYLLGIAFLVLLLNWVNTTGEYILSRTVQDAAKTIAADSEAQRAFVGQFYADFFFVVNLAEMIIQLFLVSRILKYFGIRVAILILPVIALGGYFIYALYPVLSIVRSAKIAENSTDYSLNNTVRHALYLPTRRDEKFKAKQAIDSFFHRSGDVFSALLVFVGFELFGFGPKDFAIVNLVLVAVWLFLAFKTGQANQRLVESQASES
ncbi:MAG: translocase, partial [bacterium]